MKKLLNLESKFVFMAGLLLVLPASSVRAQAPALPQMQRSINVQGEAHGEFEPDQAVISFSVATRDKVLAEAKKRNDVTLEKLLAVTQKYGIAKEKVVTSSVYIAPEYDYTKQDRPQVVGYSVSRTMRITTKDLPREEELLSALIEAKIDQVNNVEFQLSEPEKHASEIRIKAFENAKARANALAEAAGSKLGPALYISMSGGMDMPHPSMAMMEMARSSNAADGVSVAPSMPGAIIIAETVNVTFGLE